MSEYDPYISQSPKFIKSGMLLELMGYKRSAVVKRDNDLYITGIQVYFQ